MAAFSLWLLGSAIVKVKPVGTAATPVDGLTGEYEASHWERFEDSQSFRTSIHDFGHDFSLATVPFVFVRAVSFHEIGRELIAEMLFSEATVGLNQIGVENAG